MLSTPVLFLIFNRPSTTEKVFEKIRQAKPARLYLAADGPRGNKEGEEKLCRQARQIVLTGIDWDCEVNTLFRDTNKGCKEAVSEAITWFFQHEESGIILEDDTLPDSSFFRFCEELLEFYKDDSEVWSISGSNLLGKWKNNNSYLWGHGGIWGWATWRRAWKKYDKEMKDWPLNETKAKIAESLGSTDWYQYYEGLFAATYEGNLDTWDVQWFFTWLVNKGKSINPAVNLVQNIGFGEDASHTGSNEYIQNLNYSSIQFPLEHNTTRVLDILYLRRMYKAVTYRSTRQKLTSKIQHWKKVLLRRW